jgi:O-antigen/teichoic acid export membrane protein
VNATLEAPRAVLRGVARGGIANLAGTASACLAGLAVTWLVARTLPPAGAGGFFSATATFALGTAAAKLGSQTSMVYWPARLRATGDTEGLRRCLRAGLVPVAGAAIVASTVLWLTADDLPGAANDPDYAAQLRALAVFLPAAALTDATLAATRGFRAMRPTVLVDRVLRPAAQVVLLALLWLTGTAPAALAGAWAAPYLPAALLAGYALARLARPAHAGDARSGFTATEFWRFSAPRAVASLAQMSLQRVDVLLVAGLAGLAPAASYVVAGRFVVLGQFVNQALSQAVQPRLAERLAVDDRAGAKALYGQVTAWLVLATWPMYLLVMTYAAVYLGLFGARYAGATTIVVVLGCAMLVATACGMVDMVLAMGGRTWWNLANVGFALGVMLAVDLVLVPRHGAVGAAIGLASAVLANNLVPLGQVVFRLGLHPFGRDTLVAMALAGACFGVPPLLLRLVAGGAPRLAPALVVTALGTAAYLRGVTALIRLEGAR